MASQFFAITCGVQDVRIRGVGVPRLVYQALAALQELGLSISLAVGCGSHARGLLARRQGQQPAGHQSSGRTTRAGKHGRTVACDVGDGKSQRPLDNAAGVVYRFDGAFMSCNSDGSCQRRSAPTDGGVVSTPRD